MWLKGSSNMHRSDVLKRRHVFRPKNIRSDFFGIDDSISIFGCFLRQAEAEKIWFENSNCCGWRTPEHELSFYEHEHEHEHVHANEPANISVHENSNGRGNGHDGVHRHEHGHEHEHEHVHGHKPEHEHQHEN
jgi:hypothetical protein